MSPNGCGTSSHRCLEIRIGKHELWTLAPQLERDAVEGIGGRLRDDLGRVDVAGEGDFIDARMHDHRLAGRFAHAVKDVDHAVGEAGLERQLGQYDASLKHYSEAHTIALRTQYPLYISGTLDGLGDFYRQIGNNDEALRYLERALEIHEALAVGILADIRRAP